MTWQERLLRTIATESGRQLAGCVAITLALLLLFTLAAACDPRKR